MSKGAKTGWGWGLLESMLSFKISESESFDMAGSRLFSFPVGLYLAKPWISFVACGYGWFSVSKIFWKKN